MTGLRSEVAVLSPVTTSYEESMATGLTCLHGGMSGERDPVTWKTPQKVFQQVVIREGKGVWAAVLSFGWGAMGGEGRLLGDLGSSPNSYDLGHMCLLPDPFFPSLTHEGLG